MLYIQPLHQTKIAYIRTTENTQQEELINAFFQPFWPVFNHVERYVYQARKHAYVLERTHAPVC